MTEGNATLAQIVRREFKRDLVADQNTDVVLLHLAASIGNQFVTIFQRNAKAGIGQNVIHNALHFQ